MFSKPLLAFLLVPVSLFIGGTRTLPEVRAIPGPTGINDTWCPDWDARKVDTQGRTIRTDGTVIEYEEIHGTLHVDAKDVTVRCVKVHAENVLWALECSDDGNSSFNCTEGFLLEDSEVHGVGDGVVLAPLGLVTRQAAVRRVRIWGGCDGMKVDGGLVRDSNVVGTYFCPSPDPHYDGWQSSSSSGPVWMLNNRIAGPHQDQTSAILLKGDSGPIRDYTIDGNVLSGGNFTFYLRNPNTPTDIRISNNYFMKDTWNPSIAGSPGNAFSNDSEGPAQCIEYENNRFQNGAIIDPGQNGAPQNVQELGGCPGITPVPTWEILSNNLTSTTCTAGDALCDGVSIQAAASGSQTGGQPRWRYSCKHGGLWHDYPACDGRTICLLAGVCDFSGEPPGEYTVRVYTESGPGSGIRVSDSAGAPFVVSAP